MTFAVITALIVCMAQCAIAFPVNQLELTSDQFNELNATGSHDALATSLLLPHLETFFKGPDARIEVEPGDITANQHFPDVTLDPTCAHVIQVLNGQATETVENSSYLAGGVKLGWKSSSVFVDAELDGVLDVGGAVRVSTGVHFFGHGCTRLARKTAGLDIKSHGKNGVAINMTASNASLERDNGTWYLTFHFHADVVGRVIQWNVTEITANGCKIKILGITIASVCGYVEKEVKSHLQTLMDQVTKIDAPKILKKLQDTINTVIGSVVKIPLKISSGSPLNINIVI